MLAVLNRYRIFLVILTLILLVVLIWLFLAGQGKSKVPSRGVFVLEHRIETELEGGGFQLAEGHDNR